MMCHDSFKLYAKFTYENAMNDNNELVKDLEEVKDAMLLLWGASQLWKI